MPVEFNWSEPGLTEFLIVCFNLGNFLAVVAFMVRGAIALRVITVIGALLQALFYAFVATETITYGLFWKSLTALIAFSVVLLILRERMGRKFAPEVRSFAQSLRLLRPGQIEKLLKLADHRVHDDERCIISQNARPDELYYLLTGSASVQKDGIPLTVEGGTFLGEIAFVSGSVATADVLISPGSHYLAWPVDQLNRLLERDDQIDIALRGLINHDLARKIAAQPLAKPSVVTSAA